MRARSLEQLKADGLLERRDVAVDRVRRWSERAHRDLRLARDVLAKEDAERAATVAYEAGFRACAGILGLSGYRLRSQPGHHRAALEGATHFLPLDVVPSLDQLDNARRFRNASLYEEAAPMGEADLNELLSETERLLSALDARLSELTTTAE